MFRKERNKDRKSALKSSKKKDYDEEKNTARKSAKKSSPMKVNDD